MSEYISVKEIMITMNANSSNLLVCLLVLEILNFRFIKKMNTDDIKTNQRTRQSRMNCPSFEIFKACYFTAIALRKE